MTEDCALYQLMEKILFSNRVVWWHLKQGSCGTAVLLQVNILILKIHIVSNSQEQQTLVCCYPTTVIFNMKRKYSSMDAMDNCIHHGENKYNVVHLQCSEYWAYAMTRIYQPRSGNVGNQLPNIWQTAHTKCNDNMDIRLDMNVNSQCLLIHLRLTDHDLRQTATVLYLTCFTTDSTINLFN